MKAGRTIRYSNRHLVQALAVVEHGNGLKSDLEEPTGVPGGQKLDLLAIDRHPPGLDKVHRDEMEDN